jgi:hypothetical protein
MHYYERAVFESVRLAHLLANAKAAVAEVDPDRTVGADLLPGVSSQQHMRGLLKRVGSLIEDDERRKTVP